MKCPICGKATVKQVRPFCSKRCADVDLARWFNGSYAVPSSEPVGPDDIARALEDAGRKPDPSGGLH
jgi:endogenous inhibitor of DNA gyrase (YacG/DUF329 family)